MTKVKVKKGFKAFLSKFPKGKLPTTLNEKTLRHFSKENKPISNEAIVEFTFNNKEQIPDEFTEFIACCRIPNLKDNYALVYWEGKLLENYFYLAIFDKSGNLLRKSRIGGTKSNGSMFDVVIPIVKNESEIEIRSAISNNDPYQLPPQGFSTHQIHFNHTGEIKLPDNFLLVD